MQQDVTPPYFYSIDSASQEHLKAKVVPETSGPSQSECPKQPDPRVHANLQPSGMALLMPMGSPK